MECRRQLTSDPDGLPRRLEFLCQKCAVVECEKCSLAEHTGLNCQIVRLSMFTKKDINNWCLELRDKINRAIRFGNEWEEKQKQKTKFKSQISIRTEEICKLIDDQFATINDAVKKRQEELIAEAKEAGNAQIAKLQLSATKKSEAKSIMEAREMSMALWESTKNIKELTYPFLADFLRKKIEIDKKLDSVMPSLIKEENENQGGDMVGFQLGITLEVNELLKTISNFGAIRSSVVTGKKIATPESVRLRSQLSADVVVDRNGSPASVIFESEQTAPKVKKLARVKKTAYKSTGAVFVNRKFMGQSNSRKKRLIEKSPLCPQSIAGIEPRVEISMPKSRLLRKSKKKKLLKKECTKISSGSETDEDENKDQAVSESADSDQECLANKNVERKLVGKKSSSRSVKGSPKKRRTRS